jgi:HAD superfamily hydrolase (TIGR01509 family)
MAPRGFFVDLDGTLADSVRVLRNVYREFMRRMDRPESDAEFEHLKGPPLVEVVSWLRVSHRLSASQAELERIYRGLVDDAYAAVDSMPHAAEVLTAARRAGWVVGVVTSNGTERTRAWLERTRLLRQVDLVISGDDVSRGKPDPEPYRVALARTGANPDRSIAVEDSLQGATAARAAGLRTFLLLEEVAHAPRQQGVHRIRSLAELLPVLAAQGMPAAISEAAWERPSPRGTGLP